MQPMCNPKRFLLCGRPLALAPNVTSFVQAHQALLAPALPPCLDAVQMDMEFVRGLLQRQSLAHPNYRLGAYAYTWVGMKDTHLAQCLLFNLPQYQ